MHCYKQLYTLIGVPHKVFGSTATVKSDFSLTHDESKAQAQMVLNFFTVSPCHTGEPSVTDNIAFI